MREVKVKFFFSHHFITFHNVSQRTLKVAKDGKYQVKLFDGRSKKWKLVEIDDYLPCTSWGGEMPQLLFGSIPDGKLCLALLEKAFAKLYGNWSNLSAGFPEIAWFHMTGCTELFSYSTSYLGVEPKWQVTSADGVQVMAGYWGYEESRKVVGRLSEGATFGEKCRQGMGFSWDRPSTLVKVSPSICYVQQVLVADLIANVEYIRVILPELRFCFDEIL